MKAARLLVLGLVGALAGVAFNRFMRPPPPVAPAEATTVEDSERAWDALLGAGEKALARGQLAAVKLAIESVPKEVAQRERWRALRLALARAQAAKKDAG